MPQRAADGRGRLRVLWNRIRAGLHALEHDASGDLGDFTANWRLIPISLAAIAIGLLSAYVALALLKLIGLFTNLFFFQRWDFALVSPAGNQLGLLVVLVPVVGALIIGLMARYGSERIRGHGIPEALEAILINGSRVEPRVAVLKPLSAAISIGTGGPFGAEGPDHHDGRRLRLDARAVLPPDQLPSARRCWWRAPPAGMSATFAHRSPRCCSPSSCCSSSGSRAA